MSRVSRANEKVDSCVINLKIFNKSNGTLVQTIQFDSEFIYPEVFTRYDFVRSYITGINQKKPAENGNFGDFIVADFNFDNKEDFAVISNSSPIGETHYSFYIQDNNGKYVLDKFLTEEMSIFPDEIDSVNNSLTTIALAGSTGLCKTTYIYDKRKMKWNQMKKVIIKGKNSGTKHHV
jgi:hypothetical protein